jgi:sulfide:quinone oxidoreductase
VRFAPRRYAVSLDLNQLLLSPPHGVVPADQVISVPRAQGRHIVGLPQDDDGFVHTDGHGRVCGTADVYAAGDITSYPIKQGGIAAQQADAAAQSIAVAAGAPVKPTPFQPVLRALLLTGGEPLFIESSPGEIDGPRAVGETSNEPLWWPPSKIAAHHLAPYLASFPQKNALAS